ncbi:radical SAM family heme chaperone HemW, partial [Halorhodospira neutriphila]|nr:YggW family oxidoreductase [Halorhodospira neutriphila]
MGGGLPPLSVYVHLPWCLQRCAYCDFNARALRGRLPHEAYLAALGAELEQAAPTAAGRRAGSLYIGGGTPSLFPPRAIAAIIDAVERWVGLEPGAEITLEANPGARETAPFRALRAAGVNRLSLGVQSFDDAALRRLGRIHDAATARAAVAEALAAGFASVNLDLMYALPGQGVAGARADVRRALECGVPHVSHYELTLEPETPLGRAPPADLPGEEAVLAMEAACRAELEAAGLQRYEVSAYARAGHLCAHNLGYWRFADFLGLGAGAHGKYTTPAGEAVRTARRAAPRRWMTEAGSPAALAHCAALGRGEVAVEFLLN